jgi:hypothetical protein
MTGSSSRLADFSVLPEQQLLFHPADTSKHQAHPLRGLSAYGPYSGTFAPDMVRSPIRLAMVTVEGSGSKLRDYLNSLHGKHDSPSRAGYFPTFRGFSTEFRVDLDIPQKRDERVALIPRDAADRALSGSNPEAAFLGLVSAAFSQLRLHRTEFDIVVFYFPNFLESVFRVGGEGGYEFDLHHATKAITATAGVPSQLVLDRSIDYPDRCSVLWSLAVALYAKAGGIPWKLAAPAQATAFVGLSYVLRPSSSRKVVTCCSQVFDDQGHGLQFLLFTADDYIMAAKNPFLRRQDMMRLLTKTVELYVRQAGGRPKRLVVHKTTHFTPEERDGAKAALGDLESYELLQVQDETAWRGAKGERGYPTPYPVDRGTVLPISKFSFLLWTQGDVPGLVTSGKGYFQEGKGTPSPLLVTQHAGSTPLLDSAAELLGLTKMNWNTGRLYNYLPVTVKSASTLGRIAKHMSSISQAAYQFRLFM